MMLASMAMVTRAALVTAELTAKEAAILTRREFKQNLDSQKLVISVYTSLREFI